MSKDVMQKRGKFIGKVNSLLQEFHFTEPSILTKLVNIHNTTFYGSGIWNASEMPVEEHWRVPLLQELLKIRQGHLKLGNLDTMEISYLIDNLCTS